jgi:drug/metabolite transporter (DMT)-like permease
MNFGLGEFYSIACALVWAVAVILFKKSGESLAPVPLNLFKNLVGLALMLVTVLVMSGTAWPDIPPEAVLLAFLSGFLGIGLGDTLYFRALNAIGASRMAVAQTLYSPFVIVLSGLFLAERLGPLQLVGVGAVLGGIYLVHDVPGGAAGVDVRRVRQGLPVAALSVLLMAVGIVIAKPLLERYDFLWMVTLRIVGGTLGLLLFAAAQRNVATVFAAFRSVRHWPAVIVGSILGTYVSMLLWLAGYKYTQASIAAVLNETTAVFMLALAAIFLGDRLKPVQWAGSAVAVAGVFCVVLG